MSGRGGGYPRAPLLELRRAEERARRLDVARRQDDLERVEQRLRALESGLRSRRRASTAAQLLAEERYRAELRERARKSGTALERAAASLERAVRRREVVERDLKAWERGRRRADAARDQRAAEETTLAFFRKRRAE